MAILLENLFFGAFSALGALYLVALLKGFNNSIKNVLVVKHYSFIGDTAFKFGIGLAVSAFIFFYVFYFGMGIEVDPILFLSTSLSGAFFAGLFREGYPQYGKGRTYHGYRLNRALLMISVLVAVSGWASYSEYKPLFFGITAIIISVGIIEQHYTTYKDYPGKPTSKSDMFFFIGQLVFSALLLGVGLSTMLGIFSFIHSTTVSLYTIALFILASAMLPGSHPNCVGPDHEHNYKVFFIVMIILGMLSYEVFFR